MRYFVYFSYLGTNFHGWQRQPNGISVQEVMEEAFSTILREPVTLTAAGRTDAGVHAELMVAHFDTISPICTPDRITSRLNNFLPKSIALQKIVPVRDNAHARFDATGRQYQYRVITSKNPFYEGLAARISPDIDFQKMNDAAQLLLQATDFASFCKVHNDSKTTLCDVRKAEWTQEGNLWIFTIEADRFLRNMVRAVVGTLFDVGKGKISIIDFQNIIDTRYRTAAGMSAPAEGLYLTDITYPTTLFINTSAEGGNSFP
ncbi:MAG: tRNA pseudouridine(38-40) synthase TruA [Paludibacter sp.]|nr:tRNA pseudouridine(38-40) synthase TruA [Bacteroidales bacterium]MCM1069194.1 tRNA pseudouridine(38-40) synthase TruA [Prevotella sp.]MCM1354099.1 tRNA pseudouridine(38-40) synthase TruA [Bacteroides sp.]MCM1442928.1 tRNA pseudouridine(38-40) synthase TruA [Muribaculum sp.]MCM1481749.1 tRNA pseudouridine(38-40) synthase TruA [Paludibacter sp.]